jgi:peptidoglycan/xylan/chitin deacetylase (PgdA/CDA1 family)
MMHRLPAARRAFQTRTFLGDAVAWLVFLTAGTAAAVTWHDWSRRPVLLAQAAEGVRDPRIAVLAYDRVVEGPDGRHVDRQRLRSHLAGLEDAGFHPVTLERLRRFFLGEATLPARSVLLTFDHGYLSSRDAADPVLREARWPAVMFLMTERQERRDPFFLYWPGLGPMVDSGIWEIGSHGHQGHNPVRIDGAGSEGPFFVRRAWLPEAGRQESWDEFADRVREDQRRARSLIGERLNRVPLAYAPPLKDVAVASLDPEVHRVYEDTVRALYELAFVDDLFGINDRASDPHHLRRLRVHVSWSARDLVQRLERALGEGAPLRDGDERLSGLWVAATGNAQPQGPDLVASGPVRADLWRAGSQWSEDFTLEAELQIAAGQLWVVQQSADLAEEWRWGGDAERTHLQRRRPAESVETLASFPARIEPGRRHHLRLLRRGTGLWVEWDGEPVAERPAYLPERWRGNVGLVTWGAGQPARLRLRDLHFAPAPYRVHPVSSRPTVEEVQAAIREAPWVSALSPAWLELGRGGLRAHDVDRDLLSILARRYGWEILPTLRVLPGGERLAALWLPDALARTRGEGWSGLRLDLGALTEVARDAVAAAVASRREAGRDGLRLLLDGNLERPGRRVASRTLLSKEAFP